MNKKLLYLILIVLSTLSLIGCGKDTVKSDEVLSEKNEKSIIQFNSDLISDNTMEVIEGYVYPTAISDYVDIQEQMNVKITSIECPNGVVWNGEDEYSHLKMFETYEAAEEPYIVSFKETYTGDTNTLLVYCYTKDQAVEKGMIEDTIPFTFKDFIVDGQMYIISGGKYSDKISDYIVTENLDTIEVTAIYNLYADTSIDLNSSIGRDWVKKVFLPVGNPPEGESSPFTWFKLTFTDTSCNYSQDLYISVYSSEADTTGALLAPTVE